MLFHHIYLDSSGREDRKWVKRRNDKQIYLAILREERLIYSADSVSTDTCSILDEGQPLQRSI